MFRKTFFGEFSFIFLCIGLAYVNWQATLAVFIIPLFVCRFGMMSGNWAQHAFLDKEHPENPYLASITCINSTYNKRCFNDGYHIGHHLVGTMHWSEMPEEFLKNINKYKEEGSVIFRGIDYFVIWFFLMLKRYKTLANYYVDLDATNPKAKEQIVALLKERVRHRFV